MVPRGGTYADVAASHYTMIASTAKMGGGNFGHRLLFPATSGCFGDYTSLAILLQRCQRGPYEATRCGLQQLTFRDPSTWYVPVLSPPRHESQDAPGTGVEHESRPGGTVRADLVAHLPPPRMTAPTTVNVNRGPVTTPASTPHPGASSFRPSPTVAHGPRKLLQEFTTALRNAYHEPFAAWTQGELDEMVRRKKDKDARPTYKTIARSLQKSTDEVKQAWKVYQRLEARN